MLNRILDFIFPPRCAGCDNWLEAGSPSSLCPQCQRLIAPIGEQVCITCGIPLERVESTGSRCAACLQSPPRFGKARAIARYRAHPDDQVDILASILRRYKYGLNQQLSRVLNELVAERMPLDPRDYDLVLPVPLHPSRLRWRGFNQAALIAAALARNFGRPLDVRSLVRVVATVPQTAADSETRRRNVHNAFRVKRPDRIAGKRVLLVDDVLTTGATVDECARVLLSAGVLNVDVFTIARALQP